MKNNATIINNRNWNALNVENTQLHPTLFDTPFWKDKKVFVTGHTGFKGSWLCNILAYVGAEVTGYALPAQGAPNLFELSGLESRITSIYGDIRDFDALKQAVEQARPEIVFHLAAQPLVLESYENPRYTYEVNAMGTVNLLECLREQSSVKSILNVTTDKVYLNDEKGMPFTEDMPLDGYDPYSNSKSCSELITHSYAKSFFNTPSAAAISTARAGNVIGGGDFAENRIIPDCVRAAVVAQPIEVRNPNSVRPYQHVLEPLFAYLEIVRKQYKDPAFAGWYNVGPDSADCVTTGELVSLFCDIWGGVKWVSLQKDLPHESNFLKLNCGYIKERLGWWPKWRVEQAVKQTIAWTKVWQSGGDIHEEMTRQILLYCLGK